MSGLLIRKIIEEMNECANRLQKIPTPIADEELRDNVVATLHDVQQLNLALEIAGWKA